MKISKLKLKVLEQEAPAYMVAQCIGIKAVRLSEYCQGRKPIPPKHLLMISEWFNCEPHEILGWVEDIEAHDVA